MPLILGAARGACPDAANNSMKPERDPLMTEPRQVRRKPETSSRAIAAKFSDPNDRDKAYTRAALDRVARGHPFQVGQPRPTGPR
jgi:hypothetical protein